jgi:hypothetical protein
MHERSEWQGAVASLPPEDAHELKRCLILSWNPVDLFEGGYLLLAGRIGRTGRQERDVRACRLGGWVDSLAVEYIVLGHTLTLR